VILEYICRNGAGLVLEGVLDDLSNLEFGNPMGKGV